MGDIERRNHVGEINLKVEDLSHPSVDAHSSLLPSERIELIVLRLDLLLRKHSLSERREVVSLLLLRLRKRPGVLGLLLERRRGLKLRRGLDLLKG